MMEQHHDCKTDGFCKNQMITKEEEKNPLREGSVVLLECYL